MNRGVVLYFASLAALALSTLLLNLAARMQ